MADCTEEQSNLCKCGNPHDGWPGNDGGQLCQMCWEDECDKSWWEMVVAFDKALHGAPLAERKEG